MRRLVVPSLVVVLWEMGSLVDILPDSASRPSDIVRTFVQAVADGSLLRDTWLTLEAALLGFAIAGVIALLLCAPLRGVERLRKIAVGLRLALAISLVVAVTVELVLDSRGLGHGMIAAQQALRPDLLYAQLVWLGFVGWALDHCLRFAERRLLRRRSASV